MRMFAQYVFLALISSVLVVGCSLFWYWHNVVGLDVYVQTAKYYSNIAIMIAGILGLIMVGDRALIGQRLWDWTRNTALQNDAFLWIANFLSIISLLSMGYMWMHTRQVIVHSDQAVILMNIDDLLAPVDIGYLSATQEQSVIVQNGTTRIGYRLVGSDCVGSVPIPSQSSVFGLLVFISTKECAHGTRLLLPKT
ncbi:hypothetical protein [Rhizobium ruizarguesonis]|uniref:hypothetical protein n=1 Tax=Rhizobium ruizarguesonis TaxID=2081791 RepID=UPI00102F5564|nr:hypothetical protein [Rhizobium ruizarguesonis]TAY79700.1 hypothetical protein ELH86_12450 [Rhizobium ruizarguesonis]TBD21811.1 hypothetical protein ELH23_13435 [Rhizobium ruizarguesonis]